MKKCPTSLAIREMQITTTLRFNVTPVRMAIVKNASNNNVGEDVEEKVHPYIASGTAKWCNHSGKQYGDSSENLE